MSKFFDDRQHGTKIRTHRCVQEYYQDYDRCERRCVELGRNGVTVDVEYVVKFYVPKEVSDVKRF